MPGSEPIPILSIGSMHPYKKLINSTVQNISKQKNQQIFFHWDTSEWQLDSKKTEMSKSTFQHVMTSQCISFRKCSYIFISIHILSLQTSLVICFSGNAFFPKFVKDCHTAPNLQQFTSIQNITQCCDTLTNPRKQAWVGKPYNITEPKPSGHRCPH